MLFKQATLQAIADGKVTVAFRRWRRPTVRADGTLVTPAGMLAIDSVEKCTLDDITAKDARAAGHADVAELKTSLSKRRQGSLYKVTFHVAGPDPRIAMRSRSRLTAQEIADLREQLARWDRASRSGLWTQRYLALIQRSPGVRAGDLAVEVGVDTGRFKANVRKLKAQGLTESLEVGYRLSPRGKAALRVLKSSR
jgi:GH24 family phage-related lysozyme (muramidase)